MNGNDIYEYAEDRREQLVTLFKAKHKDKWTEACVLFVEQNDKTSEVEDFLIDYFDEEWNDFVIQDMANQD